jgi:hypothetical protein
MSASVIQNRFSVRTLSKDYFKTFDHIKYIITSKVDRLPPGICLTIEMLAFFLTGAWAGEIDDATDTHCSYIYPNMYFQSHLNIACMHCIPCFSILKGY